MNRNNGNDLCTIITQAISEMEEEQGKSLSVDEINLAELQRRTGISRARLRRLKSNNFKLKSAHLNFASRNKAAMTANFII